MNMPCVSVIVPVYQAEKHIRECIDSILGQSFTDFELLLIDDGSTDNGGKICDFCAQTEERVSVVHKENGGVSTARNVGLEFCKGKYITFVDSDDTIDSHFLEFAVKSLSETPADLFISGLYMEIWKAGAIDRTVQYGITAARTYTIRELLENMNIAYPQICICGPWCKLYKRGIIQKNNIRFAECLHYGEDTCFNLDYFSCCKNVFFSQACFYHYRRENEESLFGRFHRDTYEVHVTVYSKMRESMHLWHCGERAVRRFEALYFSMLLGGIHEYYRFYGKTTAEERLRQIAKVGEDPCIFRVRMKDISNTKNRILLILLRCRLYRAVGFLFEIKYRRMRNR